VNRHYALLGLAGRPSLSDLKTAYHRLAKRNHPDLFPDSERRMQQLKMMRINEAYMSVMSDVVGDNASGRSASGVAGVTRGQSSPSAAGNARDRTQSPEEQFFDAWAEKAKPGPPSDLRTVGTPRDPAYSYYKAGFRYFNRGATELSRKEAPKIRRYLITTGTADGYILRLALRALHYFERSYSYFLVVVDKYPESPWSHDARYKLHRLEKFSAIYQRICENLSRRSSSNRSSFSIVSGADPS
jgi:curved DNA-binding protein CbpA